MKNKKETRGGTRKNAGAKPKYLEQTKIVAFRCPLSKVDELKYAVADVIGFRYKGGRFVKGEVLRIDLKGVLLKLKTDYICKNDEWFAGEDKYFNKAEMKKVSKQ